MKRSIIIIAAALAACSCSEFLEKTPANEFAAEVFFASEKDLKLYSDGLINTALPDAGDIALGEDRFTDFCGTRASKDFYWGDYNASQASNWTTSTWSFSRRVAYMLDNMPRCKDNVSEDVYNHYEGVARFWRTWVTMKRMKVFGNVYFIEHVIQPTDTLTLYGPRQDREYIFHKMREDLDFACEHCLTSGSGIHTNGRVYVNKYVALAYASRFFLYEGTYRKYHKVNPSTGKPWNGDYESPEELLGLAEKYAKELVESKAFSLNKDYRALFISANLATDEVIWGRTYSKDLSVKHGVTYKYCSTTSSLTYSPTKEYVRMFLKDDGTPAAENISIINEFDHRDARLKATILSPDRKWLTSEGEAAEWGPNWTWTATGYVWIKWCQLEQEPLNADNKSYSSIPIMRYAEVLLNYAEAAAELGHMDQTLWEQTIGALRKRAGVKSIYPGSAGYVADTWLREYYTQDVLHPAELSDVILEIRRERATELTLEDQSRYDDLMRWYLGDLIERRYKHQGWRGIYISEEDAKNGFVWPHTPVVKEDGTPDTAAEAKFKYTVSTTKNSNSNNYKISGSANSNWSLTYGTYGYLVYHYALVWDDMMYTHPIPISALNVNPNLGQNDGWEWI